MKFIDVFNGDADGICALVQWRRSNPILEGVEHHLVTGVKRDITLLEKVNNDLAKDAIITILDISFDKNVEDLHRIISYCKSIFYCDHHKADQLFHHKKLITHINTKPFVCTGSLVNTYLNNAHPLWAILALFGDGLDDIADHHIRSLGTLNKRQRNELKELGVLINYNAYGNKSDDLHIEPSELYRNIMKYNTPFDIIDDSHSPFSILRNGYQQDITKADNCHKLTDKNMVSVIMDDEPWARRISGTYSNILATTYPNKPIIVATIKEKGFYTISLRAPKNSPYGASSICSKFPTGGGREGAAGINLLPITDFGKFVETVAHYYNY